MKYIKNIAAFAFTLLAGISMLALTGCEGAETYSINSPDWLQAKKDSLNDIDSNRKVPYTFGKTTDDYANREFSNKIKMLDGQILTYEFTQQNATDNPWYGWLLYVTENGIDKVNMRQDLWDLATGNSSGITSDVTNDYNLGDPSGHDQLRFAQDMVGCHVLMKITYLTGILTMTSTITTTQGKEYHTNLTRDDFTAKSIIVCLSEEKAALSLTQETKANVAEKQPVSMVLNNVPTEVEQNSTLAEAMSSVTATVTFKDEEGNEETADVPFSSLTVVTKPDLTTVGEKTMTVSYNKTNKGNKATTTVEASASFTCKVLEGYDFGSTSDGYLGAKSNDMTVADGKTLKYKFKETTAATENWYGFILCIHEGNVSKVELRGDNWENVAGNNTGCTSNFNWDTFKTDMNGSTHEMTVTYSSGIVTMKDVITSSTGKTYNYSYTKSGFTASSLTMFLSEQAAKIHVYSEVVQ